MAFVINGTTGIATVDGSVSAPSQRGQDTNSGISYAADTIKFSTNGVERFAITNSGISGDGSGLTGLTPGITVADAWMVTSSFTNPNQNSGFIAADWSRVSLGESGNIGSAINQYGGTFAFNQTGIYLLIGCVGTHITSGGRDRYVQAQFRTGTGGHNGSFTNRTSHYTNLGAEYSTTHGSVITTYLFDATNTGAANAGTVDCFRLYTSSENSSTIVKGDPNIFQTYIMAIRLGDT